jgi:pimeloyl-ACP methyl ester carboxylesterase
VLHAHGLSASRAVESRGAIVDFSPVAEAGFRLVSYDARGHGESGGGTDPEEYAWTALAGDLLALADLLSPALAVRGIGASMGSATLLHAAVRRPDRFAALVLTMPPTAWETRAAQAQVYEERVVFAERHSWPEVVALYEDKPVAPILAPLGARSLPPDILPSRLPAVLRGAGRSDLPAPELLRGLRLPVLILAWADDPGHPESTARRLADLIPGAQCHVSRSLDDVRTWGGRAAEFLARD